MVMIVSYAEAACCISLLSVTNIPTEVVQRRKAAIGYMEMFAYLHKTSYLIIMSASNLSNAFFEVPSTDTGSEFRVVHKSAFKRRDYLTYCGLTICWSQNQCVSITNVLDLVLKVNVKIRLT